MEGRGPGCSGDQEALQVDSAGKSALAIRAKHLIDSIRAGYEGTPIVEPATAPTSVGMKSSLS